MLRHQQRTVTHVREFLEAETQMRGVPNTTAVQVSCGHTRLSGGFRGSAPSFRSSQVVGRKSLCGSELKSSWPKMSCHQRLEETPDLAARLFLGPVEHSLTGAQVSILLAITSQFNTTMAVTPIIFLVLARRDIANKF